MSAGAAVRTVGGHSVVRVDDGEDARPDGDLFAFEAARVASAVIVLMVTVDDLGSVLQRLNVGHDLVAQTGVAPHLHPLVIG